MTVSLKGENASSMPFQLLFGVFRKTKTERMFLLPRFLIEPNGTSMPLSERIWGTRLDKAIAAVVRIPAFSTNAHLIILLIFCSWSCSVKKMDVLLIDRDLNPYSSGNKLQHQLVFSDNRGNVGYSQGLTYKSPSWVAEQNLRCNKSWVLFNWGAPDRSYKENGIDCLIYSKKSKFAPNYEKQFIFGETQIKLGYQKNKLIRVEAFFEDRPAFKGQNPYTLPR